MPRALKHSLTIFVFLSLFGAPAALARQTMPDPQFEQAVALYRKGEVKGAVKQFRAAVKRRQDDPLAWSYLGQALAQTGDLKEARKAFDAALKLSPDYALAHSGLAYLHLAAGREREAEAAAAKALTLDNKLKNAHYVLGLVRLRQGAWLKALEEADAIIRLDADAADAYSLKTQALTGLYDRAGIVISEERRGVYDYDEATVKEAQAARPQWLREASESLATYLRLRPDTGDAAGLREELEALRFYAEATASADPTRRIYRATEAATRAVITFKPEPGFTDNARRAGISGTVRLRAVLGADGKVKHILVLKRLSHGLTEQAVKAARQMKFKPAMLGGQLVSQYVVLEYYFNVY